MSSTDFEVRADALMEYSRRITAIQDELQGTIDALSKINQMINDEGIYEGAAEKELSIFYSMYMANAQKLSYYYSMATRYIGNVITTAAETDEEMAAWVTRIMDEGGM